ncbi:Phage major tail tube protein [Candidatus Hepatincolaceae symbiont of Richtersius coronifer]
MAILDRLGTIPKVVKDFAVYLDGKRYAGQVSEIELPKIIFKTEDYRAGYGSVPITTGLEAMEATITMVEQVKDIFMLIGVTNNTTGNLLEFRGYQEGDGGMLTSNQIIIRMRGILTEYDMGSIKRGELPSYKIKMKIIQYSYFLDNTPLSILNLIQIR